MLSYSLAKHKEVITLMHVTISYPSYIVASMVRKIWSIDFLQIGNELFYVVQRPIEIILKALSRFHVFQYFPILKSLIKFYIPQ